MNSVSEIPKFLNVFTIVGIVASPIPRIGIVGDSIKVI